MPSQYNKKPKGRIGMVGAILKKIGDMLGGPKARRLDDRRASKQFREEPDQDLFVDEGPELMDTIKKRKVTNGHDLTTKASERVRVPGQPKSGRRYRKDRRRKSKFAIEKRKIIDRGKTALKVSVPASATSVAAGVYSRKNKEKNNGKVEAAPDYTKGGTLKLRQLKPHEIEDMFHSGIENPRANPPARAKLSKVSKEKARRDRINTERILRMKR